MHRGHVALFVSVAAILLAAATAGAAGKASPDGSVYTLTNSPAGNAVAVFARADDGTLTPDGHVPDRRTRNRSESRLAGRDHRERERAQAVRGQRRQQHDLVLQGDARRAGVAGDRSVGRRHADQPDRSRPRAVRAERRRRREHHRLRREARRAGAAGRLDAAARRRQRRPGAGRRSRRTARRSSSRRRRRARSTRTSVERTASPARRSCNVGRGRHAVRLRLRQARRRADVRTQPGRRSSYDVAKNGSLSRDQRRGGDAPGRAVLARHEQGRPLRVHGERRQRDDLRLLGRPRRQPLRCSIRAASPATSAPAAIRSTRPSAATASSCTCSSTDRTRSARSASATTAASRRSAPRARCRPATSGSRPS